MKKIRVFKSVVAAGVVAMLQPFYMIWVVKNFKRLCRGISIYTGVLNNPRQKDVVEYITVIFSFTKLGKFMQNVMKWAAK